MRFFFQMGMCFREFWMIMTVISYMGVGVNAVALRLRGSSPLDFLMVSSFFRRKMTLSFKGSHDSSRFPVVPHLDTVWFKTYSWHSIRCTAKLSQGAEIHDRQETANFLWFGECCFDVHHPQLWILKAPIVWKLGLWVPGCWWEWFFSEIQPSCFDSSSYHLPYSQTGVWNIAGGGGYLPSIVSQYHIIFTYIYLKSQPFM